MAGAGGATAVQQPAAAPAGRSGAAGAPDPRAEALRCPRCDSANTKFCYYNNYSLSQPRHFCKACKRYWTRGGTLRNVPVGGGCRKNKRSRSGGNSNSGGRAAAVAGSCAAAAASSSLPQQITAGGSASMQSLTSALGLHGSASLASLLLGNGGSGGDHLGFFHAAMQSVVSDSSAYEMHHHQQQQQSQVDHLLGLGYGDGGQIQLKPWMHESGAGVGGGGIMDSFYAPLLSSSLVPGLEELHVKAEAAGAGDHNNQQKAAASGEQNGWEMPTPSSSNIDANIIASDALMDAAASMNNPTVSSATTAPSSGPSFMYWGNGGGGASAWPDIPNCGSSIATLF